LKRASDSERPLRAADVVLFFSALPCIGITVWYLMVEDFRRELSRNTAIFWAATGALSLLSGAFVLLRRFRKDRAPDLLTLFDGVPLEIAGVQLLAGAAPESAAPGSPLRLHLFLQNRFAAASRLRVRLRCRSAPLETAWELDVAPEESAFVWRDVTIPPSFPEGLAALAVDADGAQGPGREVRFREGKVVRSEVSRGAEFAAALLQGGLSSPPAPDEPIRLLVRASAPAALPQAAPEGRISLWTPGVPPRESIERLRETFRIAGLRSTRLPPGRPAASRP
jgi:hypothetical protein